jgi:hypothetical protein
MLVLQDANNVYSGAIVVLATKVITIEHDGEKLL